MDSDTFINSISIKNQENFSQLDIQRVCQELRKEIYNFLISRKSEEEFFDINIASCKKYDIVLEIIYEELEKAGWKYKTSYGDTGLFIFKENKPINCW